MPPIKYAVWSAVSSEKQAATDKVSLTEQVTIAHHRAQAKDWQPTGLDYIVPGESRTRYVNLRDAESEIPQLHQMLNDAQARKFDLLILYDYNRLRDLIDPVAKTLAAYGVQIYSCNQAVDPISPAEFTTYASDSESIMRGMAQILSRSQISDLQRKYAAALPKRITERGLPMRAPYGYITPRPGQPAIIEPHQAQACILAKDMALSGASLRQICDALHQHGHTGPQGGQFSINTVRSILSNPYYAGLVFFRRSTTTNDPRSGKRTTRKSPPGRMIISQGKHPPLWTVAEHEALTSEMEKRTRTFIGRRATVFSGLLYCHHCGSPMTINYAQTTPIYKCRKGGIKNGHIRVHHSHLLAVFVETLYTAIQQQDHVPQTESLAAQLAENNHKRQRITDAYAAGAFELAEFLEYKKPLDIEAERLENQIKDSKTGQENRNQRARLAAYIIENKTDFLASLTDETNSQAANHTLRSIIHKITVHPGPTVQINFR